MTNRFGSSMSNNSSGYGSKKRSLLGYEDPDAEAMAKQTQEQLAAQNEAKVSRLATWNSAFHKKNSRSGHVVSLVSRLASCWRELGC